MSAVIAPGDPVDILDVINRVAIFNGGPVAYDLCAVGQRTENLLNAAREAKKWLAIFEQAEDSDNTDDALEHLIMECLPQLRTALAAIKEPPGV